MSTRGRVKGHASVSRYLCYEHHMTIDVLLVDDHTIFRSGLKRLFLDEPDLRVADEARNGNEALDKVRARPFHIVVLDINMEGRSGLEVLAAIRAERPRLPVLMLSMYPEQQYALVAIQAGANGYIAKDAEPDELLRAIRRVAGGGEDLRSPSRRPPGARRCAGATASRRSASASTPSCRPTACPTRTGWP